MRLFLAVVQSIERLAELQSLQSQLLPPKTAGPDRLSWDSKEGKLVTSAGIWRPASADQLHLTLQFLGDNITLHQAHDIQQALGEAGGRHAPFAMYAGGLGAFPTSERASVLWAGLESAEIGRLAQDIEATLAPLGIGRDKPLVPHITLARSRTPQDAQTLLKPWAGKRWSEQEWKVDEFVLFESKHILQGREHHVVEKYRLAGK